MCVCELSHTVFATLSARHDKYKMLLFPHGRPWFGQQPTGHDSLSDGGERHVHRVRPLTSRSTSLTPGHQRCTKLHDVALERIGKEWQQVQQDTVRDRTWPNCRAWQRHAVNGDVHSSHATDDRLHDDGGAVADRCVSVTCNDGKDQAARLLVDQRLADHDCWVRHVGQHWLSCTLCEGRWTLKRCCKEVPVRPVRQ